MLHLLFAYWLIIGLNNIKHECDFGWRCASKTLMISSTNVMSNAPLKVGVFVGLYDGKNGSGRFGDVAY